MKTSDLSKKEFYDNKRTNNQRFCLTNYQRLVSNIINPLSPYEALLVYASVGIGKTLLSIAVADNFKKAGYKILVVLKNETLINSYKKELTDNKCKPGNIKDYTFMTYHSFNVRQGSLNNTIIIVDEAHNITDVETYTALKEKFGKSIDSRIILMSATPVYDSILEVFQLNNILNAKEPDNQLPIKTSVLLEKGYISKGSNSILESAITLTEACKKILTKTMHNKVSYFHSETSDVYAKKMYIGEDFYNKKIKLFISKMSSFQKEVYKQTFTSKDNTLFKKSTDASTIVYPNGSYGTDGFKSSIKKDSDLGFLKMENLNKYSCKLYNIVKCIKEHKKGSIFIFSNYTNNAGSDLIDKILKINGIRSFVVINGSMTSKKVTNVLKKFNSPENKDGQVLRIIIGSPFISEGITLKNVRYIHILEPSWNMSSIDQIIGRGVRYLSHSDLEPNERKVEIYLHAALDKKDNSIDILKYKLSHEKDLAIKDLEYLLRSISIDCFLNKYKVNPEDYSRECLYKKCNYTCESSIHEPIDNTTYNVALHDSELHSFIQQKIQELYYKSFIYSIDYIVKYIKEPQTTKVLYDLIKKETVFYNKNNVECKLINLDSYVLAQPLDLDVNLSYYYKVNNVHNKTRGYEVIKIKGLAEKKALKKVPGKVSYKVLDEKVYGTIINGIFRIVTNNTTCAKNDNRCLTNGKACLSFDKTELQKIALLFGLKLSGSKVDICNDLQKYFINEKLIAS